MKCQPVFKKGYPPTANADNAPVLYPPLDCGPAKPNLDAKAVLVRLLESHQITEPHHEDLCRLCLDAKAVLQRGTL